MKRRSRRVLSVGASVLMAACASGGGIPTSPYASPTEPGLVYKYGNFCGPGVPSLRAGDASQRAAELRPIAPADDLDMACKVHDICYEVFGHNEPGCDMLMQSLLADTRPDDFVGDETIPCANQVREIAWGFEVGSAWDTSLGAIGRANMYYSAVVVGATAGPFVAARQAAAAGEVGFPSAPGVCVYNEAHRSARLESSRQILAQLEAARLCYGREAEGQSCNMGRERDRLITQGSPQAMLDALLAAEPIEYR